MTAHQDAPQHDLPVDQSGSVGGRRSNAQSGPPWQRLGWFLAALVLTGFVLNVIWEMAQMSAYVETVGHTWTSTLGLCSQAALGDVEIILGIYAVGALAAGEMGWGLRGRWDIYATAAVLGLMYATLVEHAALASGRWSYTESMPVVPVLGAGLWPLLQMTLLPPLTIVLGQWWADRNVTRRPL